MEPENKPRLIAFYLPQYHPIRENDLWWGRGFTEWTNVVKARPLFPGHYQPHLPADLGFCDLRLPETRQAQADLARAHGIHGFCYYHYWFEGGRLLERPFQEVLASGQPDFPFCLCWANENWTRRWDGQEHEILRRQTYSIADDVTHIQSLMPAFQDPRYIRVQGKPLFLVYRVNHLSDPRRTAEVWRGEAKSAGLAGLYLSTVTSLPQLTRVDPIALGFDAAVDFQPDWSNLERFHPTRWQRLRQRLKGSRVFWDHHLWDYPASAERMMKRPEPAFKVFPGVTPGWDNSPRRKLLANILVPSTPEVYGRWLRHAIGTAERRFGDEERLVFINAWNEWGEGNHLEPDQRWGRRYLEETRDALQAG